MLEVEQLDRTRLAECQGRRLLELLQKIDGRNQFYTRKFREAGVDIATLRLPDDFTTLPLTTKAELNADQAANPPWGTALTEPLANYTRYCQTSSSWVSATWAGASRAASPRPARGCS